MFVGVSGLIGAGKSTLTSSLARELDARSKARGESGKWEAAYEPVEDNPYLEDFYLDFARWTFNMQMFLLARRFQQHQEVLWNPVHRNGGGVVQDRTIYEDTIFARLHHRDGLMIGRDWETYIAHFNVMKGFLRYPDVILYLRVSPEKAMERIALRDRSQERGKVPLAYLQALHEGYEEFIAEMTKYTVVVTLDWEEFIPTSEIADRIESAALTEGQFLRSLRRI